MSFSTFNTNQLEEITDRDVEQLRFLHQKFFPDLQFFDLVQGFAYSLKVERDNKILAAAGIRFIPELIGISNLDVPFRHRREAYLKILQACMYITNRLGHDKLYIFADGDKWVNTLKKSGFDLVNSSVLSVKV